MLFGLSVEEHDTTVQELDRSEVPPSFPFNMWRIVVSERMSALLP